VIVSHSLGFELIPNSFCEFTVVKLWDGEASWSPRGALCRDGEGALEWTSTAARDDRSSIICMDKNVGLAGHWDVRQSVSLEPWKRGYIYHSGCLEFAWNVVVH
jgi:hypothetical protein